jgi:nickel/cobalt transporter (NicO) family protein
VARETRHDSYQLELHGKAYMGEVLVLLAANFLNGAIHAIQPGHGKTIAAAYIVGARGRPVDAWILGIFVTLSHTSGIVLVGVLASLGLPQLPPQRIEAHLAVATGVLVIMLGLWMLWTQRALFRTALWNRGRAPLEGDGATSMTYRRHDGGDAHLHGLPGAHAHTHGEADHGHEYGHDHAHAHDHHHEHPEGEASSYHSHGWGIKHTHDVGAVTSNRPSLWILIWLGIAGGLLPDPGSLVLLMNALFSGKVMLALAGVLSFSVGFAAVLVAVGVVAAWVGKRILDWVAGPGAARIQIGTSLVMVVVGVVLTVFALQRISALG